MFRSLDNIPTGLLTLLCEGSNNPYSKNYSRKLRVGARGHVFIGKGYNLTIEGEKQALCDLSDIGLSKHNAQLIAKAGTLKGLEALQFIKFYQKETILSANQEEKLFKLKYSKIQALLQSKVDGVSGTGFVSSLNIPSHQLEVLVDFLYSNDLNKITEEKLFSTLRASLIEGKPKIFDNLVLDANFWRKAGVPEDRLRMRCIYINEWRNFSGISSLLSLILIINFRSDRVS